MEKERVGRGGNSKGNQRNKKREKSECVVIICPEGKSYF